MGRSEENDKVIMDPCTSRHHLQIIQHDDGHFTLSDFGSSNGTFVNGQKISGEIPLTDMDIVRIGNTTIPWRMYFDEDEQPSEEVQPQPENRMQTMIPEKNERQGTVSIGKKSKIFISLLSIYIVVAGILAYIKISRDYVPGLFIGSIVGAVMIILGIWLKAKSDNRQVLLTQPNGEQPGYLGPFANLGQNFVRRFKFRESEDTYVCYTFFMLFLLLFPTGCYRIKFISSSELNVYGSEKMQSSEVLCIYLIFYGLIFWLVCMMMGLTIYFV